MTINDNSTKSINAAIIDLQNQMKQLQHKIDILSKNQLKEDDIEFPGKVEYADEAGKAKEADHAKTADTAKYSSETENAVHAGTADSATKATQDGSGNVITSTYLPLSGGAMTGDIQYKGSKATENMIKFIDNTNDAWGNGIAIGGGGATIIGGGESSDVLRNTLTSGGDELMKIGNDTNVEIWTNLQDGIASGKKFTFGVDGNITTPLGTVVLKGEVGVPQVVHFNTSNSAGSYELVHFNFRSAFRCVISGTCANYAEVKIIDVIASSAASPQSNTLGNTAIGPQGNFSFDGGDWVSSIMYWNKPLTEENVYYTVVLIPYSENNVHLVI